MMPESKGLRKGKPSKGNRPARKNREGKGNRDDDKIKNKASVKVDANADKKSKLEAKAKKEPKKEPKPDKEQQKQATKDEPEKSNSSTRESITDSDQDSRVALYQAIAPDIGSFSEKTFRSQYVINVLSLFTCMLMIITTIACMVTWSETLQLFLDDYWYLGVVAGVAFAGCSYVFGERKRFSHKFPTNYILLVTMTVCNAVLMAYIVTHGESRGILIALISTCVTIGIVSTLSAASSWDLTSIKAQLLVALLVLTCIQIGSAMLVSDLTFKDQLVGGIGALLFPLYLAYDIPRLQLNPRFELNSEDYIGAVTALYLDVFYIWTDSLLLTSPRSSKQRPAAGDGGVP